MRLRFTKMEGAGNDFVVLDATRAPLALTREQLRRLGDRRTGVGADQILVVEAATQPDVDFGYRIWNGASGDEVEHCGNGARCFMRFVLERGLTHKQALRVRTLNNLIEPRLEADGRISVDMNRPRFEPAQLPFDTAGLPVREQAGCSWWTLELPGGARAELTVLSMGNPHAVLRVDDVTAAPVASWGPAIEAHPRFARKVNVGFVQVLGRDRVALRVWERDAGETPSCGTGACAAVVAGIRSGWLDARVQVQATGGLLEVAWPGGDASVRLGGPARTVFEGEIEL